MVHQMLEHFARVLASLAAVVQKVVRLARARDRHDESVGDEMSSHLDRPANDMPGEQVDGGRNVEPTCGSPEVVKSVIHFWFETEASRARSRMLSGAAVCSPVSFGICAVDSCGHRGRGLPARPHRRDLWVESVDHGDG